MTDEHDPNHESRFSDTQPLERRASDLEYHLLAEEIDRLRHEIEQIKADEEVRISTLEANINEWGRRYSYGKGIIAGVVVVFGVFGIFVVDTVREVLEHVFTNNVHKP